MFKNIKNKLKIFQVFKQTCISQNIREHISKTIIKKLFCITITTQT